MDIFRKVYTPITQINSEKILAIKDRAEELYNLMNQVETAYPSEHGRLFAIAKTNLETAIMYAVKALSSEELNRESDEVPGKKPID